MFENSNDNNNNNNEILFWKIFKNKFLLNKIFNHIHLFEWSKIKNVSDYQLNNKIKFKYITSLYNMIKDNQINLLKCKLENNEYIEIDENAIKLLFSKKKYFETSTSFIGEPQDKFIESKLKEIGYYRWGDEKKILEKNEIEIKNKEFYQANLKEILNLLIKFKMDQLIKFDILYLLLSNKEKDYQINIEFVNILLYQSIPITDKSIQYLIQNSTITLPILEIIINLPNFKISDFIKNNSISWVFKNVKNKIEILEFILNNNQLYNLPPIPIPTPSNKRFKNQDGSSITVSNDINDQVTKINYTQVFTINSSNLINKLYKLNYLIDDIGSFNSGDNENSNTIIEFKEIFKYYSNVKSSIYLNYLNVYDEMIDGCDPQMVLNYSIQNKNSKALKYLLDNKLESKVKSSEEIQESVGLISNEFIKFYTIGYNNFKDTRIDKCIIKYIHSIKCEIEFQVVYDLVADNEACFELKSKLSRKWFDINKLSFDKSFKIFIIKDTETIDYIFNDHLIDFKNYFGQDKISELYFSSIQLTEYTLSKYPEIFIGNEFRVGAYEYPFSMAIYNCDVDELKRVTELLKLKFQDDVIEEFPIKFEPTTIYGEINPWLLPEDTDDTHIAPFNFKNQPLSKLIQLLDYLNETGFQCFQSELFVEFIKCICSTPNIDLRNLKINFTNFRAATVRLFVDSIKERISSNIVYLILNSSCNNNLFIKESILYDVWDENDENDQEIHSFQYYDHEDESFKKLGYSTLFYKASQQSDYANDESGLYDADDEDCKVVTHCTTNDSIQEIKSIIKILLAELVLMINKKKAPTAKLFKLISSILNLLFKRLIKINNITFEQVDEIYQLITKEWLSATSKPFKFQHTLYHIFYYLGIKSLKLIRPILTNPIIRSVLEENHTYCNEAIEYEGENFYSKDDDDDDDEQQYVLNNLNPKVYTFKFIFNSSVDTILQKLIQDLVYSISPKTNSINHEKSLNSILIYFLEIREFDLFFEHLDKIKILFGKKNIDFNFSNDLVYSACVVLNDQLFQKFIEFNSFKSIKDSLLSHNNDVILSICNNNQFILNLILNHFKINDFKFLKN